MSVMLSISALLGRTGNAVMPRSWSTQEIRVALHEQEDGHAAPSLHKPPDPNATHTSKNQNLGGHAADRLHRREEAPIIPGLKASRVPTSAAATETARPALGVWVQPQGQKNNKKNNIKSPLCEKIYKIRG